MKLCSRVATIKEGAGYLAQISLPQDAALCQHLKLVVPGARHYQGQTWSVPVDGLSGALKVFGEHELQVCDQRGQVNGSLHTLREMNPKLYPFQAEGVKRILANRSYLLNYEMGLGKTPTSIEALRQSNVGSTLVICPALVRLNWIDELRRWWPDWDKSVNTIDKGAKLRDYGQFTTISYELSKKLPLEKWDSIIVDESHYIKNPAAGRTEAVRKILDYNPGALRIFLTATPITNRPGDLWYQIDSLYPSRFGTYWQFVKRYCIIEENEYSKWLVRGIRPDREEELAERLGYLSMRVTKQEVAHLLPSFVVQPIRVKPAKRGFNARELTEEFAQMRQHNNKADWLISKMSDQKLDSVAQMVTESLQAGTKRVCVLTHLRATVDLLRAKIEALVSVPVHTVTGDVPIKARMQKLKEASEQSSCVLICTMHSVNVGINMVAFTHAIFAELDYTPANMIQALGRFHRLSGHEPVTVSLMILQGTIDEIVASRLEGKIGEINKIIKAGVAESGLNQALSQTESDEDYFAGIQAVAATMLEEEYL